MNLMDKDAFIEKMKKTNRYFDVKFDIEEMPVIDPIHAAGACYCKECENFYNATDYITGDVIFHICLCTERKVDENDFCSYGELRIDNG